MKLVIISDTHGREPDIPKGDVLIHCGDLTMHGGFKESARALDWFESHSHRHKIMIPGNHELFWEKEELRRWMWQDYRITFLLDNYTVIDGLKFWGSPVQPYFHNWAFQKQRGPELKEHWAKIPDDTDVLITHGPPEGIGDTTSRKERIGDRDLLDRVLQVKPQIHCFGHNHDGYGEYFFEGIHFINAAQLDENYRYRNSPVEVDIDARTR